MKSNKLAEEVESLECLLEYVLIQINNSIKLTGYSNDPSFYHGKIDALQDIRREIVGMINKKG